MPSALRIEYRQKAIIQHCQRRWPSSVEGQLCVWLYHKCIGFQGGQYLLGACRFHRAWRVCRQVAAATPGSNPIGSAGGDSFAGIAGGAGFGSIA